MVDEFIEKLKQLDLPNGSLKDKVFEVLMFCFEALNPEKHKFKEQFFSMDAFLNCDHLCDIKKLSKVVTLKMGNDFMEVYNLAIIGIFIKTYPVFLSDETPDLSKVMAELDQNLDFLKPFVNFLNLNSSL